MILSCSDISETEVFLFKQFRLDAQVWAEQALTGKLNTLRKQFQNEWIPKLRDRGISIPADETEFIALVRQQEDFVEVESNRPE